MSEEEIYTEFCQIFGPIFGISTEDLDSGKRLKLQILQRTGPGSRTLHARTVAESFKWCGTNLATMAKSGAMIYIQVEEDIPGIEVHIILHNTVCLFISSHYSYQM